ncbi:YihY/virulence factor BrkB family protein [Chloroflexia bacterium SDU3-3]|nr:YihY/virulence factor BrkB family protein [Chloroflexia bacterium SDU3-3]
MLKEALALAKETWKEFQDDEAMQMSAALSYYALFSLLPLILLITALLGFALQVFPSLQSSQNALLDAVKVNFSAGLAGTLEDILAGVQQNAGAATWVGLITLLMGASGVFQQLDANFKTIWKVPKATDLTRRQMIGQMIRKKISSFLMVLAVGALLIISTAITGVTQALVSSTWGLLQVAQDSWLATLGGGAVAALVAFSLNVLIFLLVFKYLPDAKVHWRDIWPGALITALLWEAAKRLLALYIGNMAEKFSAYGAIGGVLIVVAWVYFSSLVLYLGAEFTYVSARRRRQRREELAGQRAQQAAPQQGA